MDLSERVLAGNVRAAARLMTALECNSPHAIEELRSLYPHIGKAHVVGVTGAPGVGKSTLIDSMIRVLRRKGLTLGILAVDPTSPFTGGALLGDRVRMEKHNTDPGVFIRSLGTRGGTGGLSRAVLGMAHVLDAMGKDIIIIETVGIGQAEIDITRITDTSVLVLVPGMGDTIQLMKAGILEAADIFVVNKSSQGGADTLKAEMENMMSAKDGRPVYMTEAALDQGTADLAEGVLKHKQDLMASGELKARRRQRARYELMATIDSAVRSAIDAGLKDDLGDLLDDLSEGRTDPYSASESILAALSERLKPLP
jgi:LAO/AO transport system kinase